MESSGIQSLMVATVTTTRKTVRPGPVGAGRGGNGFRGDGSGGGPEPSERSIRDRYRLGMWIGLASILMLFAAFTSAYIYRQGLAGDWQPIQVPRILWTSTLMLISSSITLELSRRALRAGQTDVFNRWLSLTALLGVGFLFGQWMAWRTLAATGVYMATNPNSSFFYLLTGAHGLHLLGGITALTFILLGAWRDYGLPFSSSGFRHSNPSSSIERRQTVVEVTAIYWHFMDGLWVYLFILLLVWR